VDSASCERCAAQIREEAGEYSLQDGFFGWTYGALRVLIALYPDAANVNAARPPAASSASVRALAEQIPSGRAPPGIPGGSPFGVISL
jgi:hypothetical protein